MEGGELDIRSLDSSCLTVGLRFSCWIFIIVFVPICRRHCRWSTNVRLVHACCKSIFLLKYFLGQPCHSQIMKQINLCVFNVGFNDGQGQKKWTQPKSDNEPPEDTPVSCITKNCPESSKEPECK